VEILLRSDASKTQLGLEGNLIINLLAINTPVAGGKAISQGNRPRPPLATLPAIPFVICKPN